MQNEKQRYCISLRRIRMLSNVNEDVAYHGGKFDDELIIKRRCQKITERLMMSVPHASTNDKVTAIEVDAAAPGHEISMEEVIFIRQIMADKAITGKASIYQLCSSIFKLSRHHSHPERCLGKKRKSWAANANNIMDDQRLIAELIIELHANQWDLLVSSSARQHAHVLHFYVCTCSDILKWILKNEDSLPPTTLSFRNIIIDHAIDYVRDRLSRYLSIDSTDGKRTTESSIYWPKLTKCLQLLLVSITAERLTLEPNEGNHATMKGICELCMLCGPLLIHLSADELVQQQQAAINASLKSLCMNLSDGRDVSSNPLKATAIDAVEECIIRHVGITGLHKMIVLLSNDDKNMIHCLLQLAEIQLRLQYIITSANTNEASKGRVREVLCSFKERCDIGRVFIEFIQTAIALDVSVLLDLLSNNETQALQYLLRVVRWIIGDSAKHFKETISITSHEHRGCKSIMKAEIDSGSTASCSETCCRCIILSRVRSSSQAFDEENWFDNSQIADIEWARDGDQAEAGSIADKYLDDSESNLVDQGSSNDGNLQAAMVSFLTCVHDTLKRREKLSMLPFNPTLLCQKLFTIIQALEIV